MGNNSNNNANNTTINWNNIIKQDTRSIDDANLGKVQGLFEPFVVTERGTINKEKFYIPKDLIERYNGEVLYFNITEQEAKDFCLQNTPPADDEAKHIVHTITERRPVATTTANKGGRKAEETVVPITEERLDASKIESTIDATIIKEPVTQTKTVEVPVTHEEISIERTEVNDRATEQRPVQSRTETKVPLKREEVQVTKQPYVKEEIVINKKPVTETKTITEDIITEKVTVRNPEGEEVREEKRQKGEETAKKGLGSTSKKTRAKLS